MSTDLKTNPSFKNRYPINTIESKRKIVPFSLSLLHSMSDIPLYRAAEQLGVSTSYLKSACRSLGIARWPRAGRSTGTVGTAGAVQQVNINYSRRLLRKYAEKNDSNMMKDFKSISHGFDSSKMTMNPPLLLAAKGQGGNLSADVQATSLWQQLSNGPSTKIMLSQNSMNIWDEMTLEPARSTGDDNETGCDRLEVSHDIEASFYHQTGVSVCPISWMSDLLPLGLSGDNDGGGSCGGSGVGGGDSGYLTDDAELRASLDAILFGSAAAAAAADYDDDAAAAPRPPSPGPAVLSTPSPDPIFDRSSLFHKIFMESETFD